MLPFYRSLPFIVCAAIAFVALAAIGSFPLFGGPGYESALAAGLVLPTLAAISAALDSSDPSRTPSAAFVRSLEGSLALVVIAFLLMMFHGLIAGFCDAGSGLALFVLGPALGAVMGAVWGFVVGQLLPPWKRTTLRSVLLVALATLGPAMGVAISLGRFFTSPMVFAYDPFFGFFSGTLYDTIVTDSFPTLLTYRAGSIATIVAVGALAFSVTRPKGRWFRFSPERHPGVLWFAMAAAVSSLIISIEGNQLGHWQTSTTIADTLGAKIADERCELLYPRAVDDATARLLLQDCTTQSRQVAEYLGLERAPQVRVLMFTDPDQKRALTGASRTSVAKPWRQEVYVQLDEYPHPVLGHEVAHVLAGTLARGPFKVAGSHGGWMPDPGLIEGIAVAASPDDDVLTPQQWSAAMLELGVLPPLDTVFGLGFLGENSSTAYTAAGAFVQWIRDQYGMDAVSRWYGGATLEEAAGASLGELETRWRTELEKLKISEASLAFAKSRFDRPSVFRRRCPHAVDAFNDAGQRLSGQGDCVGATVQYERAIALDRQHSRSLLNLADCAVRVGGPDAAREQWRALADDGMLPDTTRLRARESLADLHLSLGENEKADAIYAKLLDKIVNESQLRTIDVKLRASRSPFEARPIRALLVGEPGRGPDHRLAFALLGKWMADVPGDGLPAYLIGRNLMLSGSWQAAGEFLDWALERELAEPRVMREALRLRVIVACAQRDEVIARRTFARWKAQPDLQEVRWRVLQRRLGSCVGD